MSRKYLIISIVSLVLISGGMALYYFLGIKESFEVIPPPNTEVQKLETSTGVSEVVSGEIDNVYIQNN
jgi:hypothetical protein